MPTAKKPAKKAAPKAKTQAKKSIPVASVVVSDPAASKLTWVLTITFFILSMVFLCQAYYSTTV